MSEVEQRLFAVSPIDGRYGDKTEELQPILSEFSLIRARVAIETRWLSLLGSGVLPDHIPLSDRARDHLITVEEDFRVSDAEEIKTIEKSTKHDVKAVEIWLRENLKAHETFDQYIELIHFGATSEDINNLAYGWQLQNSRSEILQPNIGKIANNLESKAEEYSYLPMLGRTHGQPAIPTTLGKEMRVFSERVRKHQKRLGEVALFGKFNGATGNFNAMVVAYPDVDWQSVTSEFVKSLGFEVNDTTTQIEPHDWMAVLLNEISLGNSVLTDLSRDMWSYISMGYFAQETKAGEVGSSTMPHKVNPIDFENAEANFGLANGTLNHLALKLPISRLQRDLSDSSAQRAFGEAIGHTVVAQKSLLRGLGKVHANPEKISEDLNQEWSILTEAVQTVMRRYSIAGAYEAIKAVSRGKSMTKVEYIELVESVSLPEEAKDKLRDLTPATYIGLAPHIAKQNS